MESLWCLPSSEAVGRECRALQVSFAMETVALGVGVRASTTRGLGVYKGTVCSVVLVTAVEGWASAALCPQLHLLGYLQKTFPRSGPQR